MMCWNIIGASATGNSHKTNDMPCQDSFAYCLIDENCGIAIIADGAGSCANSHIGSDFVTSTGVILYKKLIIDNEWHLHPPSQNLWRDKAIYVAHNLSLKLNEFADNNSYILKSLSSTLIVIFFLKDGVYSLNIGDGRGAFKRYSNKWKSIVTPYHGEQVGMTVFLTSAPIWDESTKFIHTEVYREEIKAFIILSDGFEKISFECYTKDDSGLYYDPNLPFDQFLNFILDTSKSFLKKHTPKQATSKWEQFLKDGNEVLATEYDDKTMIFGLLSPWVSNQKTAQSGEYNS